MSQQNQWEFTQDADAPCPECGGEVLFYVMSADGAHRCQECGAAWHGAQWLRETRSIRPESKPGQESNFL